MTPLAVRPSDACDAPLVARPAEAAAVRIDRVSKSFRAQRGWRESLLHPRAGRSAPALQEITCEIPRGELFGLLGPNGAGKSTLLRVLATLVLPDSGTAWVGDADVVRNPHRARQRLAPVLGDDRSLNWRLSARENLRLFAALHGLTARTAPARINEVLEVVELAGTMRQSVGSFSSGMRQRLLLARALLARPQVLLLDEPTRSLDPVSAHRFRTFLREEVVARRGCTVLLATHTADEAFGLCDRVGVLDRGRLLAVGPAEELSTRVGRERYRVWTREPAHSQFVSLARRGLIRAVHRRESGPDEWSRVEFEIPGREAGAASVLSSLIGTGVPVARFECVHPTLAEMIESVVGSARHED